MGCSRGGTPPLAVVFRGSLIRVRSDSTIDQGRGERRSAMFIQARRLALFAFLVLLPAGRVRAQGDVLESKEELRLKYDVAVRDLGDGQVAVEFTLADDGRLKPLRAVELHIAGLEKDKGAD